MRRLRNKNDIEEKLLLDVSKRKATLKTKKETINYTPFIEFDKNTEYEKIKKIRLVNNY